MPEEKAAGLGTAAASRSDYTRNYTIPATTLLTRLSAEFQVIAKYRPLAIGIHLAMRAATPGTSNKLWHRALALHCGSRRYLDALAAGGSRYALDGSACGEVTEPQREAARAKLGRAPAPKVALPTLSLNKRRRGS